MSEKPTSKPAPGGNAADDQNDEGMYDLAEDPDEKPAKPARRVPPPVVVPGAAAGAPAGAGAAPPKRHSGASSAMQGGAVLAAARTGPRRQDTDRQAAIDTAKKIGLLVGGIILLIAVVMGIRMLATEDGPVVGDDAEAKSLISDRYYEEMRGWMSGGKQDRTLVGHSPGQTEALVNDLYDKGAKTLLAGGTMQSSMMVIELPEDEATRGALIDWANEWHGKYQMIDRLRRKDEGQRYLVVQMPLNR